MLVAAVVIWTPASSPGPSASPVEVAERSLLRVERPKNGGPPFWIERRRRSSKVVSVKLASRAGGADVGEQRDRAFRRARSVRRQVESRQRSTGRRLMLSLSIDVADHEPLGDLDRGPQGRRDRTTARGRRRISRGTSAEAKVTGRSGRPAAAPEGVQPGVEVGVDRVAVADWMPEARCNV